MRFPFFGACGTGIVEERNAEINGANGGAIAVDPLGNGIALVVAGVVVGTWRMTVTTWAALARIDGESAGGTSPVAARSDPR